METRQKILVVDDDPELLKLYRDLLGNLPSHPEVQTANSGARAMALMEAEPFRLLICDLKMPKMDGLQVLSIVRRKHPNVRTVALTGVVDEQFRPRAYAMGVDLFWQKPTTEQEIQMFQECLESLLGREGEGGFRGVQSKSLVDIIQLECLSQSSSVLRITNGPFSGKIWIQDGEVIDAEAAGLAGECAFQKILSWKAGNFETLPAEPSRARIILKPYSALLLESAQAFDESVDATTDANGVRTAPSRLAEAARREGVDFVLAIEAGEQAKPEAYGLENPDRMAAWARQTLAGFATIGEQINAGPLDAINGFGPQRHVSLARHSDKDFCVGWKAFLAPDQLREKMKQVLEICAS